MKEKLTPLNEINDEHEFWTGTRFRQYGMGLNVENNMAYDFYEYMLAEMPGERDFMLLTCVEGYKSGNTIALVKTAADKTKFIVTGKAMKDSMGMKDTFLKE